MRVSRFVMHFRGETITSNFEIYDSSPSVALSLKKNVELFAQLTVKKKKSIELYAKLNEL